MAITSGDIILWRKLRDLGALPHRPRVLEIGEANWYGDATLLEVCPTEPFAAAKHFYFSVLGQAEFVTIDLTGTDVANKCDLNKPLDKQLSFEVRDRFDIVINTGTCEHVFDQAQVFRTIHECCKVGGLMVHCLPVRGWTEHGFYTYSTLLLDDLAFANRYEELYCDFSTQEEGGLCHLAWQKTEDVFKVPIQRKQ